MLCVHLCGLRCMVFSCLSVMVCLSLAGVSKAVEHINKTIAPALVSKVGPFIVWIICLKTSLTEHILTR